MKLIRRVSALAAGLVLAASAFVPQAAAESQAPDPAWEKFASARRVFQVRLCELASRRWPEFSSFFADHRDLQLAYLERRNLAFYRLMAVDPARIVRTEGGQRFLGFAWTSEEDRQFQETVPGYAQVTGEIGKLKAATEKFKNREALKDRFARLELDPEYLALMRDMGQAIADGERMLQSSATPAGTAAPPQTEPGA